MSGHFWDYCGEREAKAMNCAAKVSPVFQFMCKGQVPESIIAGKPTDISAISAFEWWEIVRYKIESENYPFSPYHIGRCLGPSENIGSEICFLILTEKGKVIPVSTVRYLTPSELNNPKIKEDIAKFDLYILIILHSAMSKLI